jgi:hypothetical protein
MPPWILDSGYRLLTTCPEPVEGLTASPLSKWKSNSLHFAENRVMEEFEFEQCLETMAVLAHKIRGICSEKAVGSIPFKIYAFALGRLFRVPLVSIVTGWAGDITRNYRIT